MRIYMYIYDVYVDKVKMFCLFAYVHKLQYTEVSARYETPKKPILNKKNTCK